MADLRQAAQQALEALCLDAGDAQVTLEADAIAALRKALEQPERPNLLGWSFHRNSDGSIGIKSPPPKPWESQRTGESVYPTDGGGLHELLGKFVDHINALQQPEQTCNCRWVGDVQTQQCTLHEAHVDAIHEWAERAKAAEAKLAALEQQEQAEPVAWTTVDELARHIRYINGDNKMGAGVFAESLLEWMQSKAAPPRREWVGLTEEEIRRMGNETPGQQGGWNLAFARAIEARLKELNHE